MSLPFLWYRGAKANTALIQHSRSDFSFQDFARVKGERIPLSPLFDSLELFKTTEMMLYGKRESVQYYSIDLLWGKGLYT